MNHAEAQMQTHSWDAMHLCVTYSHAQITRMSTMDEVLLLPKLDLSYGCEEVTYQRVCICASLPKLDLPHEQGISADADASICDVFTRADNTHVDDG